MLKTKLLEVWIINKSGISILHVKNSEIIHQDTVDPVLFSGIITAMECTAQQSLESIKMKDSKIVILPQPKCNDVYLVGRAPIKTSDNSIRKVLVKIKEEFDDQFQEIIGTWEGNLSIFYYFRNELEKKYFSP